MRCVHLSASHRPHVYVFLSRFELRSEFEREVSRRLWEWNLEQNNKIEENEMVMMKEKIAEQLRNEKSGDEL